MIKAVLDACVLYPTVMREILLGAAKAGFYTPLWSDRILEEWARAARKIGPEGETVARGEIALIAAQWPTALVDIANVDTSVLWLPDPDDIHVLAGAIEAGADLIITQNRRDFPAAILAESGMSLAGPDELLLGFHEADPDRIEIIVNAVHGNAEKLSGKEWTRRALLKKARLPRLGKRFA